MTAEASIVLCECSTRHTQNVLIQNIWDTGKKENLVGGERGKESGSGGVEKHFQQEW